MWTSPVISVDNFKYYLILVDHYTRYTLLYPLKTKSHVRDIFITFQVLVENRFSQRIGTLYSDNGGKFIALRPHLFAAGISNLTSPPHTPEHNRVSERKHCHVMETDLSLLTHAGMKNTYWTYAFAAAVYLIKRLPTLVLHMKSPLQKLFGTEPNYAKLRVYGCLCFPWLRPYNTHKLENRSTPCVFLGYSLTQSAYICLQPTSGRIYVSRHVKLDEHSFPFRNPTPQTPAISHSNPISTSIPFAVVVLLPLPTALPLVTPSLPGPSSSDRHRTVLQEDDNNTINRDSCMIRESSPIQYNRDPIPNPENRNPNPTDQSPTNSAQQHPTNTTTQTEA